MKNYYCCYCNKEIDGRTDNNYIWFTFGRGILCKECYQSYEKEIESIEKKYKIRRGFVSKGGNQ